MDDEKRWQESPQDAPGTPTPTEDAQESSSDRQIPPRYGYYHVHEERPRHRLESSEHLTDHRIPRKTPFVKKLGQVLALGLAFGLSASLAFQATGRLTGSSASSQTTSEESGGEIISNLDKAQSVSKSSDTSAAATETVNDKGTVAEVAQNAMPSVVAITTVSVQEIRDWFGGTHQYESSGSGSGIIVGESDEELLIATNNHVVSGATNLSVFFYGSDVTSASAADASDAVNGTIKGTDESVDLAVVSVRKSDIPEDTMREIKIADIGNSEELVVGEQVVAIGNALGYGQSVTSGWVSALNRTIIRSNGETAELIQTDAAINPGNSGGALLNMKGELIGINSAKYADSAVEGMGYAIPISKASPILEKLMTRTTRTKQDAADAAYLGVKVTDLSVQARRMYDMPTGAFVLEVTSGAPAEKSGLKKSDIIVELDGNPITGSEELIDLLQYYKAGETVDLVIARADSGEYVEQTITVTMGAQPSQNG